MRSAEDADPPDMIAFEETRGLSLAEIAAAFEPDPGSPPPRPAADHLDVTGVRGTLVLPGARIRVADLDQLHPWPVR